MHCWQCIQHPADKKPSIREQWRVMFDDCSVPCWMLKYQKCYISCLTYNVSSKNRASFNVVWKWDYEDAGRSGNHLFREMFVLQCFFRCHSWVIVSGRIVGAYSKTSFRMVEKKKLNHLMQLKTQLNQYVAWILCIETGSLPKGVRVYSTPVE